MKCWKQIGTEKCILTHLSCHSWRNGELEEGLSHQDRLAYEAQTPGLTFAFDGMRVTTDLDGNPRFLDIPSAPDSGNGTSPLVDMGAYEAQLNGYHEYLVYLPLTLKE